MRIFAARHRAAFVAFGCLALVAGSIGAAAFVVHRDSPDRAGVIAAPVAPEVLHGSGPPEPTGRSGAAPTGPSSGEAPTGPIGGGAPSFPGPPGPSGLVSTSPEPPASMPYPGPSSHQLPAPGPEQPADPASARQAVSDLIARAWTPVATDAQRFENFDDSHGFDQVMQELRSGRVAAEANSAVSAKVDDVVFLTPTRADIQFTFTIANYGTFPGFFGEANLRDGEWKLTRSTFCNSLPTTGSKCPD